MIDLLLRVGEVAFALMMIFGVAGMALRFRPVKWVWRRLVTDPWSGYQRKEITEIVTPIIAAAVRPLENQIQQINEAVNNTGPGEPKIKDRVKRVEKSLQAQDAVLAQLRLGQRAQTWDDRPDDQ